MIPCPRCIRGSLYEEDDPPYDRVRICRQCGYRESVPRQDADLEPPPGKRGPRFRLILHRRVGALGLA